MEESISVTGKCHSFKENIASIIKLNAILNLVLCSSDFYGFFSCGTIEVQKIPV